MPILVSPEGRVGRERSVLAPSVASIAGLRLSVLSNGKPNARLLLSTIAARLADHAGARVSLIETKGTAATPCEENLLQHLRGQSDLVLTGSAD